ncbi:MAG: ferrochelatase [Chitinophagaceae bacterium]|nr:MAG: ferrochelatase [Chitinophagaceae bacterium]
MENPRKAILLMNLGSPDSTSVKDLRKYLNEFLMDERVIDIPYLLRSILVKGIIVPLRAPKSAKAYKSIWTKDGSPLIVLTKQLQQAVQAKTDMPVEIAMRYGNPTPTEAMDRLKKNYPDLEEVIVVPLYPHYAWSSYETAVIFAQELYLKGKYPFRLSIVPPFYKDDAYIEALADSMRPYTKDPFDLLVFSYHGIPERHIKKRQPAGVHDVTDPDHCCTDPVIQEVCYRHQVITTTRLVAEKLGLPPEKYTLSFQSRLGRDPWLQPYTAKSLEAWPGKGYKKILLACPAFVSDCLETLEEMGEEGREIFLHNGGESFTLIPCLNTNAKWVDTVLELSAKAAQVSCLNKACRENGSRQCISTVQPCPYNLPAGQMGRK